jgi:hypothetical protein
MGGQGQDGRTGRTDQPRHGQDRAGEKGGSHTNPVDGSVHDTVGNMGGQRKQSRARNGRGSLNHRAVGAKHQCSGAVQRSVAQAQRKRMATTSKCQG